jgi:hypothetical protein
MPCQAIKIELQGIFATYDRGRRRVCATGASLSWLTFKPDENITVEMVDEC